MYQFEYQDEVLRLLNKIVELLQRILSNVRARQSATLTFKGESMPATILVGKTAQANWQEWSGPNGTGDKLPAAGPVTFSSATSTVATVDPSSGLVTGVSVGSSVISGTDTTNNLMASDTINVTETAVSATLTLTANP